MSVSSLLELKKKKESFSSTTICRFAFFDLFLCFCSPPLFPEEISEPQTSDRVVTGLHVSMPPSCCNHAAFQSATAIFQSDISPPMFPIIKHQMCSADVEMKPTFSQLVHTICRIERIPAMPGYRVMYRI